MDGFERFGPTWRIEFSDEINYSSTQGEKLQMILTNHRGDGSSKRIK